MIPGSIFSVYPLLTFARPGFRGHGHASPDVIRTLVDPNAEYFIILRLRLRGDGLLFQGWDCFLLARFHAP
jgi:hypothetical protein